MGGVRPLLAARGGLRLPPWHGRGRGTWPSRRATASASRPWAAGWRSASAARCASPASARSRSARLTMPTILPSRTTGTRLMRWVTSRRAISAASAVSSTVTTGAAMTSRAVCSGVCRLATKSGLSGSPSAISASHQSRRASRSLSPRPIRSPSLTMPTGAPALSITGTALMPRSSSRRAIACVGVPGDTTATSVVINSRACVIPSPRPPRRPGRPASRFPTAQPAGPP